MVVSVVCAREELLRIKPPKVNPFKQIWKASKKIPKPFARAIPSFLLANIAIYQYQVAFTDFMGSEIFHSNNAGEIGSELKKNLHSERRVVDNDVQFGE